MSVIDDQSIPYDAAQFSQASQWQSDLSHQEEDEEEGDSSEEDEEESIEDSDRYINVCKLNHPVDIPASTIRKLSRDEVSLTGMIIQSIVQSSVPLTMLGGDSGISSSKSVVIRQQPGPDSGADSVSDEDYIEEHSTSGSPQIGIGVFTEFHADQRSSTFFAQLLDSQSSSNQFRQLLISQSDRLYSQKTINEIVKRLDVSLQ